jgi:hypothetical protein
MLYLKLETDYNDGDRLMSMTRIEEEDLPLIRKVARALWSVPQYTISTGQNIHRQNWITRGEYQRDDEQMPVDMYKGMLTEDEVLLFEERYVPMDEHCGCHTINVMVVMDVREEETLL